MVGVIPHPATQQLIGGSSYKNNIRNNIIIGL